MILRLLFMALLLFPLCAASLAQGQPLAGTKPLTDNGDLAAEMVSGLHSYLSREVEASAEKRADYWHRDFASAERYSASLEPNRKRFRKIIGLVDPRETVSLHLTATFPIPSEEAGLVGRGPGYRIYAVRWNVLRGVEGEGLLLQTESPAVADIVALPDCDWTPEMLVGLARGVPEKAQFARRLAENGCRVLVPMLLNRQATYSGQPGIAATNQTHREFLYRAAYEMGRHIIGYEIQKTLAGVDWFLGEGREARAGAKQRHVGVMGYGEGGLIAFYAAAVDPRIDVVAVSGYFQPRERLWSEPIYRNVFGLLREFGDAEIAGLIAPRPLIIEACRQPEIPGPPQTGRGGAAPGALATPPLAAVEAEFQRARAMTTALNPPPALILTQSEKGRGLPGTDSTLTSFLQSLGARKKLLPTGPLPKPLLKAFDTETRLKRQFDQIAEDTQILLRDSPDRRRAFWARADFSSPDTLEKTSEEYRTYFLNEILGALPDPTLPANPRTRKIYDTPKFTGYEVKLDLYPDVFAYGILLIPKNIPPGERRPVVVCQHGLEGRAQDVADPAIDSPYYHQFACKLAERGYITYAPQNPYIGEDRFRLALRKAQPLHLTLFSFIVRQHQRTLEWLAGLPEVDPKRIAFYGLSYGGKTAMRIPAVLPGYCLSICSADYNEWIWKNVSIHSPYSYLFGGEYDMPEFDLGNTFNYAEMSWLICPRPFMVERGHQDGVSSDEWVSYEYARTRRVYDLLGLSDRTEMEIFNGPHTIHGVGTFAFLDRHLKSGAAQHPPDNQEIRTDRSGKSDRLKSGAVPHPPNSLLPGFHPGPWFEEQVAEVETPEGVRMLFNTPSVRRFDPARPTRLIFYATPNGNTAEQTLGSALAPGTDWHFDIQHIAAQTRRLREVDPGENIVLVCLQAEGKSWPAWRQKHPDNPALIRALVESAIKRIPGDPLRVTLTGHSGGGSFLFGFLNASEAIPEYVERIAFLDANYSYSDADKHGDKLLAWLDGNPARHLVVLAYDDRDIQLNGKPVIGPDGGTYRASHRMLDSFGKRFAFIPSTQNDVERYMGMAGQCLFLLHKNPDNKILHTALVGDMNGYLMAMTQGTPEETKWGHFGGPRAYTAWVQPGGAISKPATPPPASALSLPPRPKETLGGAAIMAQVESLSTSQREAFLLQQIMDGNIPDFLRTFKPIRVSANTANGVTHTAVYEVMPDYLAVGNDSDFVRVPLTPMTALHIADRFGCTLPTRKIVNDIYVQAELKLEPHPLTQEREAAHTFLEHNSIIEGQRGGKPLGLLVAGIKKDVVNSKLLLEKPNRVAIYGWHKLDGTPIQPLTTVHKDTYVDYSHGIRLIRQTLLVDGKPMTVDAVLQSPDLHILLTDE